MTIEGKKMRQWNVFKDGSCTAYMEGYGWVKVVVKEVACEVIEPHVNDERVNGRLLWVEEQ